MIMEDPGPETSKRQRLDSMSALRVHPQHQQAPPQHHAGSPAPEALHTYPTPQQTLAPPNAYADPVPPSPYQAVNEPRHLSEHPASGGAFLAHSGYSTPVRETHAPLADRGPPYSRNGHQIPAPLRDPTEVSHPGAFRPTSTTFDTGGPVYSPTSAQDADQAVVHYAHEPPTPNGIFHGLPMSAHHDPSQTPGPPGAVATQYAEAPHPAVGHAPQGGPPYSAGPYGAPSAPWTTANRHQLIQAQQQQPRKPSRALQACETCRARKAKCDEGKPVCGYCQENGHSCKYKEVQPAKADRAQQQTMDAITKVQVDMGHITADIGHLTADNRRMERAIDEVRTMLLEQRQGVPPRRSPDDSKMSISPVSRNRQSPAATVAPLPSRSEARKASPAQTPRVANTVGAAAPPLEPNLHNVPDDSTMGELMAGSFQVEHSTGAHNLFKWLSVQRLLEGRLINENFVMQHEVRKGLLHIYGRGQSIDTWDGGSSTGPGSPVSTTSEDLAGRSPGSTPPDTWGTAIGRPSIPESRFVDEKGEHPGGLNPDGTLKLDRETMVRLEQSYLDNMWLLHPFLDKARLRRMSERVYHFATQGTNTMATGVASRSPHLLHSNPGLAGGARVPSKRKLSTDEPMHDSSKPGSADAIGAGRSVGDAQPFERRVATAIVLLVMALGKICEHTDDLPGPVPEAKSDRAGGLPMASPATSSSSPVGVADGRGGNLTYRGTGAGGSETSVSTPMPVGAPRRGGERNMDVIPGLAYFAKAVEILGALQGNDLPYVQANLLAALYSSQMACVLESWTWIQHACRACHFIIHDSSFTNARPARAEAIKFAYWTCHQLEGDILAELDLRSSGIAAKNETIPHPDILPNDQHASLCYNNQIYLRGALNDYQSMLYPSKLYQEDASFSLGKRNICDETLTLWRAELPAQLQWKDNDPPPGDINNARLRAKYYGAKYIIHRPYLYFALQYHDSSLDMPEVRKRFHQFERHPEDFHLATGIDTDKVAEQKGRLKETRVDRAFQLLMSCRMCIDAAKRSTVAFDGIWPKKRLILTNIFGTAHAQFGNVLVLAAVLHSRLHWLVNREEVLQLLRRTIRLLRSLTPISSTLAMDANILETVLLKVDPASGGGATSGPSNLTTSFSSQ